MLRNILFSNAVDNSKHSSVYVWKSNGLGLDFSFPIPSRVFPVCNFTKDFDITRNNNVDLHDFTLLGLLTSVAIPENNILFSEGSSDKITQLNNSLAN